MTVVAGLDVGGAHLKVALVENGQPVAVEQFACPLWQGIGQLDAAMASAQPLLSRADRIAVTMTGELSDLFDNRREGVTELSEWLTWELGDEIRFWQGARGFGTCDCAIEHHADTGSTNFLATSAIVAQRHPNAMLLDFGSTTADIIPIIDGHNASQGLTDAVRQTTGELVYTGYTRTAVMGVVDKAPFKGQWVGLAREYLATMADVRRILGDLDPSVDMHASADGRGKSLSESTQRFARMLGRDASEGTVDDWQLAARHVSECQLRSIHDALTIVLSRQPRLWGGRLVTAGIGADAAAVLALRAGLHPVKFGKLFDAPEPLATRITYAAPAVAVAVLLHRNPV